MLLKLKEKKFKNIDLITATIVFIFFLTIFFLSPINGDDWGNYIIGLRGPRGWIGQAIGMYFDWEGRFFSRILINALTANKWLWNVFNAFSMSSLFYISLKLINANKKYYINLLLMLGILLIGKDIFTQTFLWIAGNLTYFTPLVLLILYFYLIERYLNKNQKN